jgi:hypothetical protein
MSLLAISGFSNSPVYGSTFTSNTESEREEATFTFGLGELDWCVTTAQCVLFKYVGIMKLIRAVRPLARRPLILIPV